MLRISKRVGCVFIVGYMGTLAIFGRNLRIKTNTVIKLCEQTILLILRPVVLSVYCGLFRFIYYYLLNNCGVFYLTVDDKCFYIKLM